SAPPDAPWLRHPLDDPPGLGVGKCEAGRPMREPKGLADLTLRERHAADHQVRVHPPDRGSDAPGRAHVAPRVRELEAQRLRGLQAAVLARNMRLDSSVFLRHNLLTNGSTDGRIDDIDHDTSGADRSWSLD